MAVLCFAPLKWRAVCLWRTSQNLSSAMSSTVTTGPALPNFIYSLAVRDPPNTSHLAKKLSDPHSLRHQAIPHATTPLLDYMPSRRG